MIQLLVVAHALACIAMATIVSFVHVVQYPLLRAVPEDSLPKYEREYTRRAGYIIAPLMLVEAASAICLVVILPDQFLILILNLLLLAVIWVVTFFVSVPAHEVLAQRWSGAAYRRLMWSNGIRLVAWIARVPGVLMVLFAP